MAWSVKCWLCKHEDLSLIPQNQCKNVRLSDAWSSGEMEMGDPWDSLTRSFIFSRLVNSKPVGDPISKIKGWMASLKKVGRHLRRYPRLSAVIQTHAHTHARTHVSAHIQTCTQEYTDKDTLKVSELRLYALLKKNLLLKRKQWLKWQLKCFLFRHWMFLSTGSWTGHWCLLSRSERSDHRRYSMLTPGSIS